MRTFLSFLGSLGVGVMLTGFGLLLDAATLIYAGIIIFTLMAALWLWWFGTKSYAEKGTEIAPDPKEKALTALYAARLNGMRAVAMNSEGGCNRAFHEIEAAWTSARRVFQLPELKIASGLSYVKGTKEYIDILDAVLPHLREGHVNDARRIAIILTS